MSQKYITTSVIADLAMAAAAGSAHAAHNQKPSLAETAPADVLDGVTYIGAGGGGGNLEDFTPTRQGYSATTYRGYHYGLFDVSGDTIRYELRDTEGRLRDTLSLVKQGPGRAVFLEQAVADTR